MCSRDITVSFACSIPVSPSLPPRTFNHSCLTFPISLPILLPSRLQVPPTLTLLIPVFSLCALLHSPEILFNSYLPVFLLPFLLQSQSTLFSANLRYYYFLHVLLLLMPLSCFVSPLIFNLSPLISVQSAPYFRSCSWLHVCSCQIFQSHTRTEIRTR